jgi:hypothetical protein
LQAQRPSQEVGQAGDEIGSAGKEADAGAAANDDARAQQHLANARQQLNQDIAQAQQELFFEQVARLEHALEGLIGRQKSVVSDIARLEGLRTSPSQNGEWTASQRTSVRALTEQEQDLAAETTEYRQQLAQAEAFRLALDGAVREMTRAANRLENYETDAPTHTAASIALARLEQLHAALQPDPPPDPEAQPQSPPGNNAQEQSAMPPPADALHLLAELKLVTLLQAEVNRRTAQLEASRDDAGNLPEPLASEMADLALEQGKLADLVTSLYQRAAAQAQGQQQDQPNPAPPENPPPARPQPNLDEELEKSLDNALLP